MSKKEAKTNAVRILETMKIPYEARTYECDEFGTVSMLDTINEYYSDGSKEISPLQKQFNSITNLR